MSGVVSNLCGLQPVTLYLGVGAVLERQVELSLRGKLELSLRGKLVVLG